MRFGAWLAPLRADEVAAGVDHYELACHPADLTQHIRSHLDAAALALGDGRSGVPEPFLAEDDQRASWEEFRTSFIEHMAVLLDHVGHALNAVGCTDAELDLSYPVAELALSDDAVEEACSSGKAEVDEKAVELTDSPGVVLPHEEKCEQ